MEKFKPSMLAAVFQNKDGGIFFVEYQTSLDLDRLTKEHQSDGSKLVEATSIDEAKNMTRKSGYIPEDNSPFQR